MFKNHYKEDALKWRAHQSDLEEKAMARKFCMIVEIVLKDGDKQYRTYEKCGYRTDVGFLVIEWMIVLGSDALKRQYEKTKELAGTEGIECDSGIFVPHSNIHHIKNLGIYEVASE